MQLQSIAQETYCLRTQQHAEICAGENHICYRCGMLIGPCRCPELGTPLDY